MTEAERLAERLHPKDEFRKDMSEREIENLARKMCDYPEIRAPVQGFPGGIPWEMHMRTYEAYAKRWSPQVALINLYGRGCRGGFGTEELDGFIPGWRDELSERTRLLARMAAIEEALRPFAGMRKSTEPEVSDLLNRSPSEQLRRQAELTERRDREIDNARLALGKGSE